ncbi:MAG TPA: hypothetical protein VHY34_05360 [Caulobacteraceae bacterium]|nr:hypothetical protein [Caulobacteraceae bacterium]
MPFTLALIPLLLFPWSSPHGGERTDNRHIGEWRLRTNTDAFSGQLTCRLSANHIEYGRGVLTFHLDRRVDTTNAVYRVDDGVPVTVRSEIMDMARRGFAVYQDDLANPSGGLVRIPEGRLLKARAVAIEAAPKGPIAVFKVAGFAAALDAASKAGCSSATYDRDAP